jgi:hypothetical protein
VEKWEYKIITYTRRSELEEELNHLGAHGWEAISVQVIHGDPGSFSLRGYCIAALKRRKLQPAD